MAHTGWRKPTPGLLQAEKHAKAGEHLAVPKSQAIVATKKIAAAIGLKAQDLLLLDTFGAVTQPQDWEQGRRPIVWASNNFLMEQTGFSLATLRRHIRRLCEAGVIWMKDSPNGKRWGRRDEDGYIVEAYGFDLAPLAARTEEFEALQTQLQEERQFCASLRNTITVSRRVIRAKIQKALEGHLSGPWRRLQEEFENLLQRLPKRSVAAERLLDYVDHLKAFQERVGQAFEAAVDWPEQSDASASCSKGVDPDPKAVLFSTIHLPTGLGNETHILTTNEPNPVNSKNFETKYAADVEPKNRTEVPVERPEEVDLDISWTTQRGKRGSEIDLPMLMIACPEFAELARSMEGGYLRDWTDMHRAAAKIRGVAGISEDAWNVANKVMGPAIAAATIALIYDKHVEGQVKSAGGYLRAMVKRAQAGDLHLDRSFYGRLSEARAG
ncbi:MAG: plasmid replication protein RepC [Pseudomonadota bacterium]